MPKDSRTKKFAEQVKRDAASGFASKVSGATALNLAGLDATGDLIDSGYAATDFADANAILGDTTVGRVLRVSQLTIADGTNASTLKCTVASLWNGDTITETNNVAKDGTTGNFTLNAAGTLLTIEAAGLTGNCVAAFGFIASDASGVANPTLDIKASGNDVLIAIKSSGTAADLTARVDLGAPITIYMICVESA